MHELQGNKGAPLSIFISYAHEDEPLRQQLEAHLSLLRRQGLISEWHDREIPPGAEWAQEIDEHLEAVSIILLLISADFLASDYCYDTEMKHALERHQRAEARVIPIILRPCDWQTSPFARLQCLPRDGKAVTTWQNPDEAFLTIAEGLRRVIERQRMPTRPLPDVERQNRMRLMKRVQAIWIEGVLERSLHQAALIALDLQEQPDALANPWHLEVQETNLPPRPLPARTPIVQVYDEADGELLILGEPGTGKTTLLLELARVLLDRAQADEHHGIPVVFNLSSWAQKRLPLSDWLIEELSTKYRVPYKVGQSWVSSDQILPLLDGLDEVAKEARVGCVQAINTYFQKRVEGGPAPLVVCCRIKEYLALSTRVTLQQAVNIQLLTDDQIERYMQSTGDQLEGLRHVLRQDPELYELAHRPLILSIFTLAYAGAGAEELPAEGTREARLQQVFATYVERMLARRGAPKRVSRESMLQWLTFTATRMQQHYQTVLYLEYLQPSWLRSSGIRLLYRLNVFLVCGLIATVAGDLLVGPPLWLLLGLGGTANAVTGGLTLGLGFVLFFGLLGGLILAASQIQPKEALIWSWRKAREGIGIGLQFGSIGVFAGIAVGINTGQVRGLLLGVVTGLITSLICALTSGLVVGLLFGFSTDQLDERKYTVPNQGVWISAWNGVVLGLVVGLVCTIVGGLVSAMVFGLTGTIVGLVFGLGAGLLIGLGRGLATFLQHFILRFWLWRADSLPWSLIAFLDEAVERLLLRKVGGGYIFIHRELLDYFALLEKKEP